MWTLTANNSKRTGKRKLGKILSPSHFSICFFLSHCPFFLLSFSRPVFFLFLFLFYLFTLSLSSLLNHTVGTPKFMLKTSPPWLHRRGTAPRTGNGMPNVSAQLTFITGEVLSEAGRSQRKGFFHPTDRICLPMLRPIYTQSCGKETPCGKSSSHTRVGPQALPDRLHGLPRGCERPGDVFSC